MRIGQWTEIFRAGDYGDKGKFTQADLDAMVANFNTTDQAPIVIGHPKNDSPAWGWLGALRRVGDVLQGQVADLHQQAAKAIEEKRFKNKSVRIGKTETGPKLLHLGLLGAALPHVEGLKEAQFDAQDCEVVEIDFSQPPAGNTPSKEEEMDKDQRIKDLENDLAAEKAARKQESDNRSAAESKRRQADFTRFVEDQLVAKGRIPADQKDEAIAFMMSLPASDNGVDFSVGEGTEQKQHSSVEWFKTFATSAQENDFTKELPEGAAEFTAPNSDTKLVDLTRHV